MKTTLPAIAFPAPARIGRGLIGCTDELTPAPRRVPLTRRVVLFAALAALFASSGCAGYTGTGSLTFSNGPVAIGITSDGKTVAGSLSARDGKNVVELQRRWRTR